MRGFLRVVILLCAPIIMAQECSSAQVVLIGDSTTVCKDSPIDQAVVAEQILKKTPGSQWHKAKVTNFSIGGTGTQHWLSEYPEHHCDIFGNPQRGVDCDAHTNYVEALNAMHPGLDAVVIVIGFNDWALYALTPSDPEWDQRVLETASYVQQLGALFSVPVYVGTPHVAGPFWTPNLRPWSQDVGQALLDLGVAHFSFPELPKVPDQIHLDDAACVMAGARIAEFLSTQ